LAACRELALGAAAACRRLPAGPQNLLTWTVQSGNCLPFPFDRDCLEVNFQNIILRLSEYWSRHGCAIVQPYDIEKGAGTFNPATFFRCLGLTPWRCAYVEPSRRPTDGRYGENPYRLQHFYQFQVILKPAPDNSQQAYLDSLRFLGIDLEAHDVRFVEDDWESPTLGATGLGWEVWLDGLEVTQFTYFQQMGGQELEPITVELTYGLERIGMFLQEKDDIFKLKWNEFLSYGDMHREDERQFSFYNFERADVEMLRQQFEACQKEAQGMLEAGLVLPAYDFVMRCSHTFNVLDARRALSVAERTGHILKIRKMANACAKGYLEQREPESSKLTGK
jgi:glycyl-tRNA synthetase alpha chain